MRIGVRVGFEAALRRLRWAGLMAAEEIDSRNRRDRLRREGEARR